MTELNCIAVDDEPLALELISDNISRIPFLKCLATFNSAIKAGEYLKTNKVDLIFLDIQMPDLNGVEFAKTISNTMIIFTTAYDDYALEGFEVAAVDYLLKPIMFPRFEKACLKAKEFFELKQLINGTEPTITIRSDHKTIKLPLKSILYIEGLKDYVKIYTDNNEKPFLTRSNLKGISDQLPTQQFIRTHKSFIVNLGKVTGKGADAVMLSKKEIPIGEAYKAEVRDRFK